VCGIIGVLGFEENQNKEIIDKKDFLRLVNSLKHRGPDDYGVMHEENFSFGHRRLSIIDLSEKGRQPMFDWEKKVCITFNGEIYNFEQIKEELVKRGHRFNSKTDTEVILESYKEWGIKCLSKLNGMFAFGLYDLEKKEFFLARDRLGVKPVYYSEIENKFVFASELKGIVNFPKFKKELNLRAVSCFLSFRYVVGSETYFNGVYQLEPGHYISLSNGRKKIVKYWDINLKSKKHILSRSGKKKIKSLIEDSVQIRTISDVPLGSYLSGGIDSTIILCAMSKNTNKPVETFTVKFKEKDFDESFFSDLAAKKFKAKNTMITLSGEDYLEHTKELIRFKDQPLGMHNEVAVYLMAKKLKKHVTVVLSGEGADEIFGGYGRLFRSPFDFYRIKIIGFFPKKLRSKLVKIFGLDGKFLDKNLFQHFMMQYSYFPIEEKNQLYSASMKLVADNDKEVIQLFRDKFTESKNRNYYDKIFYVFEKLHLPGLLLMMDATSMATGVEVRVPFTDYRLVQESFNIPTRYKLKWRSLKDIFLSLLKSSSEISENNDITKFILKDIFKNEIPSEIINRKKMVFPVPLNSWFRKDFSKFVRKELLAKNSKIKLVFNQDKLRKWIEHNEKNENDERYGRKIWLILNLEYWLREYF